MAGHKNRRLYHAAREEARRYADAHPSPDIDPAQALQWQVNRLMDLCRHAASKVDELPEDELTIMTQFGPVDHHWVRLEGRYRQELGALCVQVERVGLAERLVRLEEAKAQLLVRAITEAAREVGISRDKVRKLGPALRTQLRLVQGGQSDQAAA
jgi:hypothetical protein